MPAGPQVVTTSDISEDQVRDAFQLAATINAAAVSLEIAALDRTAEAAPHDNNFLTLGIICEATRRRRTPGI